MPTRWRRRPSEEADGRWSLAVHFRDPPNETAVRALVALAAGAAAANALTFETLAAKDWVRASLEGLKPVEAGRFVVHGAHDRARVPRQPHRHRDRGRARLRHRPSRHHARLPARARPPREDAARRRGSVLDVGTGTGVLAIAAAKALHRPVLASDIDARAVTIARENARLNRAGASSRSCMRPASARGASARARRSSSCSPISCSGRCSGWRRRWRGSSRPAAASCSPACSTSQASAALAAYRARGLVLERRIALEGWVTLVLRRRGCQTSGRHCQLRSAAAPIDCAGMFEARFQTFDDRAERGGERRRGVAALRTELARRGLTGFDRAARRPPPERISCRRRRSGSPGSPASPARPAPRSC